ncbi:coproporphyrinogen III oxidase [Brevundimonas sp. AAP58]|uniref:oxygen-independent coproporphyrinogen III oxidase n=1 Tax=Brevundimonas sp. AAP58 TaxID=1523422 RepID=UPI0006B985FD|nr:oxygen-independent coproporphyrinogen III oxidase [Brevundimonas sp. AAP58]KPF81633.1 coproporphyrinogen III oxidase [Brevundimonas sp. AAP58]
MSACAETLMAVRRQRLLRRYDVSAPRYTSYPTAAQFTPAVGPETWADWLRALPQDEPVGLYAHIPFCKRLCWYCGCNTRAVNRLDVMSSYVDLLLKEAEMVAEALVLPLGPVSLHLGGGTPNSLSPDLLSRLVSGLKQLFQPDEGLAFAAELDPAVLTSDWVDRAAELGLTRASLGVQDLSPEVQQAVNRIEPFEVVERAVGWLMRAGVPSVNLDLMYGLPRQGRAQVLSTLEQILTLRPDRIALFGYAHVPWMKPHQRLIDTAELPGASERFDQSQAAAERLVQAGYHAIGLDHFALPDDSLAVAARNGRVRRSFQGYTTDPVYLIGMGASSISRTSQGYVQNHTIERDWRAAIASGKLPAARGLAMTADDRRRAEIIERLMCDFAVFLPAVERRHGPDPDHFRSALSALKPLMDDDLVVVNDGAIAVTDLGRPFVRLICAAFDDAPTSAAPRHAQAI